LPIREIDALKASPGCATCADEHRVQALPEPILEKDEQTLLQKSLANLLTLQALS